jgi:hypothetical protein
VIGGGRGENRGMGVRGGEPEGEVGSWELGAGSD